MRCRPFAGLLVLGAVACGSSAVAPSPTLTSFHWSGGAAAAPATAVTATGGRGRIDVSGSTDTPTPCYGLVGELSATGSDVQVRVIARSITTANCITALGRYAYTGVVTLPSGTYALTIVHTYPDAGWPTVEAFRQTVKVE